jgi:hypothetical protein
MPRTRASRASRAFRVQLALLATTSLLATRCPSPTSTSEDIGFEDAAGPTDAAHHNDAAGPTDANAAPDAAGFPDTAGMDASGLPDATRVPDAGCVAPLANCNGSGLSCEVDTSTNSTNCGQCARSCLGAACQSSLCAVTQEAPDGAGLRAAAVPGFVYILTVDAIPATNYTLRRVRTASAGLEEVVASGPGAPGGLEIDSTYLYFAAQANGASAPTVYKKAHTASAAAHAEVLFQAATLPNWLVIRGGAYYWMSSRPSTLWRRAMNAPPDDTGTQLTMNDEGTVNTFVATSTTLYWVADTTATLRRMSITSTLPSDVPGATVTPSGTVRGPLHAAGNKIYWGAFSTPAPGLYAFYDGARAPLQLNSDVAARIVFPDPLSDQVYYGDPYLGSALYRVSKHGGMALPVAASVPGVDIIGSDADFLYAASQFGATGPVYRIVK